jgi:hypothetical protein
MIHARAMNYLVFSQSPALDEHALVHQARTFFSADLAFTRRHHHAGGTASFEITLGGPFPPSTFTLGLRPRTAEDLAFADQAEIAGRAGGMALLARRCPVVVVIEPAAGTPERALLTLCALLASALLGPVMPPDHSTLFGVRGARERAEKSIG